MPFFSHSFVHFMVILYLMQRKLYIDVNRHYIGKNFMQSSMEKYMKIMEQTNTEMAVELDRMPIGKFQ